MEDERQQIFESLMPEMDNQSIINFQQNNFEVPEQMFDDSSLSETFIEEVIIGPDITTSDATDFLDIPNSETNEEITMEKTVNETVLAPINSELTIPSNNKLFLIPMGGIDPSMLQTNLKVPSGQNIIIVKPQDLLKSVQEQKLRLQKLSLPLSANQHGLILQQTTNINQQGIVTPGNQKETTRVFLSQAQPIVQVDEPSQVNIMQANVVQANQVNQPRKGNHAGPSSQPGLSSQPKVVVEGVKPSKLVKLLNPQTTLLTKKKPVNQDLLSPRTSHGQSGKVFQEMPTKLALPADARLNKVHPGNQAQAGSRSQPATAVQSVTNLNNSNICIQVQKSSQPVKVQQEIQTNHAKPSNKTPQHMIDTTSEPLNKDSQEMQTCQDIMTTTKQPNSKSRPVKSENKVSVSVQGTGKPQQNIRPGQPKVVLQIPRNPCLQFNKYLKITSPSTISTKSKVQIPGDHPGIRPLNLPQGMPIARSANRVVMQSKATSSFSQAVAPKIPSSAPVAAPQLHSSAQSVWPSTKQTIVNLESAVDEDKPVVRKRQLDMSGLTKDTQRGPTLLGELEKRSSHSSSKTMRPGESQLKPLKHAKLNNTNLWTCCLCGKLSFEDSLGCLFGPYDENRDVVQPEGPVAARKRKRDSTSDEPESPTKLKPESNHELWFHGDCIIWSPGVYVVGDLLAGYRQAVNESRFGKCTSCGDYGASLACFQRTCKKLYHFPCAKETECIFDDSNYTIHCRHHNL